jgi:predicted Zn finger-like uncharacterized protein
MKIVCPHCTTFFAIDPAALGAAGRNVRCSRCKQVWLARPDMPVRAEILAPMTADGAPVASAGSADAWRASVPDGPLRDETPVVDSPSIASDWPVAGDGAAPQAEPPKDAPAARPGRRWPWRESNGMRRPRRRIAISPLACIAMAAVAAALIVWRAEVVRLLPQTALFYRLVGLEVNLRGLTFKDVKVSTETVDTKPVLVIEGSIVDVARKPVELPRLRFIVRDAKGTEIYAWNAVLDQAVLKPGEKAWFRSRLASPPPEGQMIDVRFFNRRDIAAGDL